MPQYSDVKLADKMSAVAEQIAKSAYGFECDLEHAAINLEFVSHPIVSLNPENLDEVMSDLESIECDMKDARKHLSTFDKNLSKLLALRLQLAEETGIPMNLSGGREWVRLVEHAM